MKKPKKKVTLPPHYISIDFMPILSWEKFHETKNYVWLLIKPQKLTKAQKIELSNVWKIIYDEYIKVFGWGDAYERAMEKRLKIAKLKLKLIIKNDKTITNFIRHAEKELEAIEKNNKAGFDIYKGKMAIEKHFQIRIPLRDTTVREYFTYLKELK